jgi:dihydrofolate reductase
MTKVRFRIAISLDGYAAGPNQSVDNPLGVGGQRLHEWVFPLKFFKAMQGQSGGIVNESNRVTEESFANLGATVMGRNMFGGQPGDWSKTNPWTGWWGKNPPYHHPVFVLTHHAREPLTLSDTTFHFVTGGIDDALAQARRAAGAKDVALAGGTSVGRQFLERGLVDEMELNVAPVMLGAGERLIEGLSDELYGMRVTRIVPTAEVTHIKYER